MHKLFSIGTFLLFAAPAAPVAAQHPRDGLLVLVDHAAVSAEAAQRCDQRLPGSGAAIRKAHARWHAQHHAAHEQLIETLLQQVQAQAEARGDPGDTRQVLNLLRAASMDKLRQSMDAKDPAALAQFCADYPAEFDKPAMDFTALWLRTRSRR